jgi:DNA repair exonuclease SbcCD ATPase subunit
MNFRLFNDYMQTAGSHIKESRKLRAVGALRYAVYHLSKTVREHQELFGTRIEKLEDNHRRTIDRFGRDKVRIENLEEQVNKLEELVDKMTPYVKVYQDKRPLDSEHPEPGPPMSEKRLTELEEDAARVGISENCQLEEACREIRRLQPVLEDTRPRVEHVAPHKYQALETELDHLRSKIKAHKDHCARLLQHRDSHHRTSMPDCEDCGQIDSLLAFETFVRHAGLGKCEKSETK